jgi:hypothetical protein
MTHERPGSDEIRQELLKGRTPTAYIRDEVREAQQLHQKQILRGNRTDFWSPLNVALILYPMIEQGVISANDMKETLPSLGFSTEEADNFLNETVPQAVSYLETQENLTRQSHAAINRDLRGKL